MKRHRTKSREKFKIYYKPSIKTALEHWGVFKPLQKTENQSKLLDLVLTSAKSLGAFGSYKNYKKRLMKNIYYHIIRNKDGAESYIQDNIKESAAFNLTIKCPYQMPRKDKKNWAVTAIAHFTKKANWGELTGAAAQHRDVRLFIATKYRQYMNMTTPQLTGIIKKIQEDYEWMREVSFTKEGAKNKADKAAYLTARALYADFGKKASIEKIFKYGRGKIAGRK